jgi:hypothetical protein
MIIRSRKQRTDIGKYSFVNRTMQLWSFLSADESGTPSHKEKKLNSMV